MTDINARAFDLLWNRSFDSDSLILTLAQMFPELFCKIVNGHEPSNFNSAVHEAMRLLWENYFSKEKVILSLAQNETTLFVSLATDAELVSIFMTQGKIAAIKRYREIYGASLIDSKNAIEAMFNC